MTHAATEQIQVEVTKDPLAQKPTVPEVTDALKQRILDKMTHNFTRAIFEFILDAERTITPKVVRLHAGIAVKKYQDGALGEPEKVLVAFPEDDPENFQVYGDIFAPGRDLVSTGASTLELIAIMSLFADKIDGFKEMFPGLEDGLPEGCDGNCETCTRHEHEADEMLRAMDDSGLGN